MTDEKRCEDERIVFKEIPLTGIRKVIAQRMSESLQKAPQATVTSKVDFSAVIAARNKYKSMKLSISYTDILLKLLAIALTRHPELNATIANGKVTQFQTVNIGLAVGTARGLFVPVIRNVEMKSLAEISEESKALLDRIEKGTISSDAFSKGTFTLSNMGMYKVDVMTPILNHPEVAIMSVGTTRKEVVVDDEGEIVIKPITTISLTLDHAALDGLPAAQFIETVLSLIENPLPWLE